VSRVWQVARAGHIVDQALSGYKVESGGYYDFVDISYIVRIYVHENLSNCANAN
jgi:hypothetical protein